MLKGGSVESLILQSSGAKSAMRYTRAMNATAIKPSVTTAAVMTDI